MFGDFKNVFEYAIAPTHLLDDLLKMTENDPINKALNSLFAKFTGTGLTGAEQEANTFSSQEAAIARQFNAEQAQKQMDFQERMANTQYQRAVSDMQAAGINPALAYSQGGNVAPSGSAATASGASSVQPNSGMSMSELVALATLPLQMRKLEAETKKTTAEAEKIGLESGWLDVLNQATVDQLNAATKNLLSEADLNKNERRALLVVEKTLHENQAASLDQENFYKAWRNQYIQETGMDPSAGVLQNLFNNAITNLAKMLEKLFPNSFHFNFTNVELPKN